MTVTILPGIYPAARAQSNIQASAVNQEQRPWPSIPTRSSRVTQLPISSKVLVWIPLVVIGNRWVCIMLKFIFRLSKSLTEPFPAFWNKWSWFRFSLRQDYEPKIIFNTFSSPASKTFSVSLLQRRNHSHFGFKMIGPFIAFLGMNTFLRTYLVKEKPEQTFSLSLQNTLQDLSLLSFLPLPSKSRVWTRTFINNLSPLIVLKQSDRHQFCHYQLLVQARQIHTQPRIRSPENKPGTWPTAAVCPALSKQIILENAFLHINRFLRNHAQCSWKHFQFLVETRTHK